MPLFRPNGSIMNQGFERFVLEKPADDYDIISTPREITSVRLIGRVASEEGMQLVRFSPELFDWARDPELANSTVPAQPPSQSSADAIPQRLAPNYIQELC